MTAETFKPEIWKRGRLTKIYRLPRETPEECEAALISLLEKAIKVYHNRGPNLRHGIALDKQMTIILSQTDGDRPLCGIYLNLSSPYHKKPGAKTAKSAG